MRVRTVFFVLVLAALILCTAGVVSAQEPAAPSAVQAAAATAPLAYHPTLAVFPARPPQAGSSGGANPDRHWEIEVHGGGFFSNNPVKGISALPAAGTPFTEGDGDLSRQVPSYFFGDGAVLANTVFSGCFTSAPFCGNNIGAPLTNSIVPLDPVVNGAAVNRRNALGVGGRIGYDFNKRWGVEYTFDYNSAPLELKTGAITAANATIRSWQLSFQKAWTNYCVTFGCAPYPANGAVASMTSIRRSDGSQIMNSLALNLYLAPDHKFNPYLTAGGGVVSNQGGNLSMAMTGSYLVPFGIGTETDNVSVRWNTDSTMGAFVFGGGFKWYVSPNWGIRVDGRDYYTFSERIRTLLSAAPTNNVGGGSLDDFNTPPPVGTDLQFTNMNPGTPSSLSGAPVTNLPSFVSDASRHHFILSGGIFFRF